MRQSNGADILGANDPRSGTTGILYISPEDERASVLAAILTQEKLARQYIAVVLPAQNRSFQRPVDFDGLKNMRRTLKAQLVIIAPQGSGPAEFARQRRFATFPSLDAYAQSLRAGEQQEVQQQKRGWPFVRKLQQQRPTSTSMPSAPISPIPQPMMTSSDQQSHPPEHNIAIPAVQFSPDIATSTPNIERLHTTDEDAAPHTEDILQAPQMVAPLYEQPYDIVQNSGNIAPEESQDTVELPEGVIEDEDTLTNAGNVGSAGRVDSMDADEDEPDLDKTLPRGRFPRHPLIPMPEPQPVILARHLSRTPSPQPVTPPPQDTRHNQSNTQSGTGHATSASRPGWIGRMAGTGSMLQTQIRRTPRPWLFALLILLLLLIIGGGIYTAFSVFGTEVTATVTITPVRQSLQQTYTIAAVTGVPNVVQSQIEARFLSSTSPAQSETVTASGRGTVPATAAKGILTFYNSSPNIQTIPTGTIVTDAKGIEVVTESQVVIPAAQLPSVTSATVNAHTINTGSASNLVANDLKGMPCCAEGIGVSNLLAFTGGQDAQTYSYIEQSDIDSAVNQLNNMLTVRAQTMVMSQIHPDEQLIGSIGCIPAITSNHAAGEKFANVTVTVAETCSGEVYNQQQAYTNARGLLVNDAKQRFGAGFGLVGNVTATIIRATLAKPDGEIAVLVKTGGVWTYQFSNSEKMQLTRKIEGKSEKDALATLASTTGIRSVTVQVNGGDGNTLPTDTKQITIVVKT